MSEIPVDQIPADLLFDEIDREVLVVQDLNVRLQETHDTIAQILREQEWEKLPDYLERLKKREERIGELEFFIQRRQSNIADLRGKVAELERPMFLSYETLYMRRRVSEILRRSVGALEGWQTRTLKQLRTQHKWLKKEENFISRQRELQTQQTEWEQSAETIKTQIAHEEDRIKQKAARVRLVQTKILVISITNSKSDRRGKYDLRFQIIYLIDAKRDPATGKINIEGRLSQKEVNICVQHFIEYWKWDKKGTPKNTTEPDVSESREFEVEKEPQGAFVINISITGSEPWVPEEADRYGNMPKPYEQIYTPTDFDKQNQ